MLKTALYDYFPQRLLHRASFEEYDICNKILAFKDGRNFAKKWAAEVVTQSLSLTNMKDTVFMCVPASCQYAHTRRYKKLSYMVCKKLHAVNGFDYIHIIGKRTKTHISKTHTLAENIDLYLEIDESKLAGKNVVVIDDITTSCKTANAFIERLQRAGANVRMALFLAKTKSYTLDTRSRLLPITAAGAKRRPLNKVMILPKADRKSPSPIIKWLCRHLRLLMASSSSVAAESSRSFKGSNSSSALPKLWSLI